MKVVRTGFQPLKCQGGILSGAAHLPRERTFTVTQISDPAGEISSLSAAEIEATTRRAGPAHRRSGLKNRRVRTEMDLEFRPWENVQKTDVFLLP